MQIILVSRHLTAARTITIMPRHVALLTFSALCLLLATAGLISWLSVHWRLPLVEDLLLSLQQREMKKTRDYLENNLQLMATRVGELQARVLQLGTLGERLSGVAGVKLEAPPVAGKAGQGGPFVPAPLTVDELQHEIDHLAQGVERRSADLEYLQFALLEKKVEERRLPTSQPVAGAPLGSPFGYRIDPVAGVRALHEGLDFSAEVGTPVLAAAEGVVLAAAFHPQYGNVVDLDHGGGLVSRYAHLSRIDVQPGALLKRGAPIGAVGNTGRSTGAHLHFEVRLFGAAQNPARFLKREG